MSKERKEKEETSFNKLGGEVRNESAEDFLELLKEWEKLCKWYKVNDAERTLPLQLKSSEGAKKQVNSQGHDIPAGEYEVSRFVDICYGDPSETGKHGLYLKVHWKGYSASEDTWEPIESLRQYYIQSRIKSSLYENLVGCKVFLIIIDSVRLLKKDNVTQRDYLRTEGDPGAAGYVIKEAVALTRSVVPGQRALALHLLSSVLDKALHYICKDRTGHMAKSESKVDKLVDWEGLLHLV